MPSAVRAFSFSMPQCSSYCGLDHNILFTGRSLFCPLGFLIFFFRIGMLLIKYATFHQRERQTDKGSLLP